MRVKEGVLGKLNDRLSREIDGPNVECSPMNVPAQYPTPSFPYPHLPILTLFTIIQHAQPNFRKDLPLRVACGGG